MVVSTQKTNHPIEESFNNISNRRETRQGETVKGERAQEQLRNHAEGLQSIQATIATAREDSQNLRGQAEIARTLARSSNASE